MAHLYRLIVCALLALFMAPASASFPADLDLLFAAECPNSPCYSYLYSGNGAVGQRNNSRSAACSSWAAAYNAAPAPGFQLTSPTVTGDTCKATFYRASPYYSAETTATLSKIERPPDPLVYKCPANADKADTQCTCKAGFTQVQTNGIYSCNDANAQAKVEECASKAGTLKPGGPYAFESPNPDAEIYICGDFATPSGAISCTIRVRSTVSVRIPPNTLYGLAGNGYYTGSTCTTDPNATGGTSSSVKPGGTDLTGKETGGTGTQVSECPDGQVPGKINGQTLCYTPSPSDTVTKSDTQSQTVTAGTSTSVTTTSSSSVCDQGKCTVTTVVTKDGSVTTDVRSCTAGTAGCAPGTASGGGGGGGSGKENPGSWAGSCGSAPACAGDAVACAVAKSTFETNCALTKDSAEKALYDQKKGLTGNLTGSLPGNESIAISSSSFDMTDAIGGASCIPDLSITVMAQTISLPFSQICQWLAALGNVLVAVSLLTAGRIVVRG